MKAPKTRPGAPFPSFWKRSGAGPRKEPDMRNENLHATLLALAGGYLLYLAYQLLQSYLAGSQDMSRALFILCIALFAVAGVGVLVYAFRTWRREKQAGGREDSDDSSPK